ncbi:WD40 repeat domain-containing protein [Streptomyces similanensis]|uniref:WD40 repeat domain-containing protein n=1 Tax=Streptomyces similanensis TaxID=1274988 RepID=A0ABP9L1K9_9ACTN
MPEHQEAEPRIPWRFGAQIVPPLAAGGVTEVVCAAVEGRPVALTLGQDRALRVWDMGDHRQSGPPLAPAGTAPVWGVAHGMLGQRSVAVLVGGGLWVWDLAERRRISGAESRPYPPGRRAGGGLRAVACTRLDGRLVAVTGGYDRTVHIWDVATAEQLGEPLCGHTGVIRSVACGELNGRPIALTAAEDETVRIWDLERREPIGRPLTGHTGPVATVAYGLLDGRPIAVSGGRDRTLRLWDLTAPDPAGTPIEGHGDAVGAVALATVAGRPVAVSGGEDVRVWDLRGRRPAGPPLFDGRDVPGVTSLACGTLDGRPLALAVYGHERVRVWDLAEHRRIGADVPDRYAPRLPARWTDPATGDVYDLTGPLVDLDGDRWDVVDYDGIEPIVRQRPVGPRVALGIADAHAQYGFQGVVTSGQ